jgi:hypothetical protein
MRMFALARKIEWCANDDRDVGARLLIADLLAPRWMMEGFLARQRAKRLGIDTSRNF